MAHEVLDKVREGVDWKKKTKDRRMLDPVQIYFFNPGGLSTFR